MEENPFEGYDIDISAKDTDGWLVLEVGTIVEGRLIGRFTMRNGRNFYQVKLKRPVKAISGRGEEAETVTLDIGQVVSFDERSSLEPLRPYAASDGIYDIVFKAIEKKNLPNNHTWWRFQGPSAKQVKAPSKPIEQYKATPAVDDDIPF